MNIEWDEQKNKRNLLKHGIDFIDSYEIFLSPVLIKLDNRFNSNEKRRIGLGILRNVVVVFVFTKRNNNLRIMSIRKANKNERKIYNEAVKSN